MMTSPTLPSTLGLLMLCLGTAWPLNAADVTAEKLGTVLRFTADWLEAQRLAYAQ